MCGVAGLHRTYPMLIFERVRCPYCGESFETDIDTSAGNQTYIEDCYVCCRPISFHTAIDPEGNLTNIELHRDDD